VYNTGKSTVTINKKTLDEVWAQIFNQMGNLKQLYRQKSKSRKRKSKTPQLSPAETSTIIKDAIRQTYGSLSSELTNAMAVLATNKSDSTRKGVTRKFSKLQFISQVLNSYLFDAQTNYGCGANFLLVSNKKGTPSLITREQCRNQYAVDTVVQTYGEQAVLDKIRSDTGHSVSIEAVRAVSDIKNLVIQINADSIASTGTIISLLSIIVFARNLQCQIAGEGQRINYDENFLAHFGTGTNTLWSLQYGDQVYDCNSILVHSDKDSQITERLAENQLSVVQRLKSSSPVVYGKDTPNAKTSVQWVDAPQNAMSGGNWGYLYASNILMATKMFSIPNECVPPELLAVLGDESRRKTGIAIQEVLKLISGANKKLTVRKSTKKQ
jgi:hypothetical protein